MPAVSVSVDDLRPFAPDINEAKAQAMLDDALALAARVAPCINDDDFEFAAAARAIIRGAVLRWNEAGTGAITQESAGPFSVSVQQSQRRSLFWPSEISDLQGLCKKGGGGKAFDVDTAYMPQSAHLPWCSLNFGATYCSCGADIAGGPIYEGA